MALVLRDQRPSDETPDFKIPGRGPDPVAMLDQIQRAMDELGAERATLGENAFEFPLTEALEVLPERYVRKPLGEDIAGETIAITIDNLFDQLGRGKVEMPISRFTHFIPLHLVYRAALDDHRPLTLPLQSVVRAVGIEALQARTPTDIRTYDIGALPNPFSMSPTVTSTEPGAAVAEPETAPPPAIAEAPGKAPVPTLISAEPTPPAPPAAQPPVPAPAVTPQVSKPVTSSVSFQYPLAAALNLMPREQLGARQPGPNDPVSITVNVPDLFDQLKKARVAVTVASLAGALPAGLLADSARADTATTVVFPLGSVVAAVGVDALKEKTSPDTRLYNIADMADPFTEPQPLPKLERTPKEKKAEPEQAPEAAAGRATVEFTSAATPQVLPRKPGEVDLELEYTEFPGNVNINAATADELMTLDGVDAAMAAAIIEARTRRGRFKNVFGLLDVPGLGPVQFRQMTGMQAEQRQHHRRKQLAGLLKIPADKVTDLALVAQSIARRAGFTACVISDRDGFVLAQGGMIDIGESLAAVMPRMLRQIRQAMDLAGAGHVDTMTLSINNMLYTMAASDNVVLTAVHTEKRVNETELSFIRKVRRELAWLLSLRAYAGPAIS